MKLFKDQHAYRNFVFEILHKSRYVSSPWVKKFLNSFMTMVRQNEARIKKDSLLYRSQADHSYRPFTDESGNGIGQELHPCESERMKPLINKAKEGRLNPTGIPYLYLNTDLKTAIAESRPRIGEYVSLGSFATQRDLRLVHFTQTRTSNIIYFDKAPKEEVDRIVWEEINEAFSTPVIKDNATADYVLQHRLLQSELDVEDRWDCL